MAKRWIQKAAIKKGALSRQLGIPEAEDIPVTLLKAIKKTTTGETVKNPTKSGKRSYKVTQKLKRRAVLALTLKKM